MTVLSQLSSRRLHHPASAAADEARLALVHTYQTCRQLTELICAALETEDFVLQCMPDVSPPKWHLAHTSWFFETFVLSHFQPNYTVFDASYDYLFNSYYQSLGPMHPRPLRGCLSRPLVATIYAYRQYVDQAMLHFLQHGKTTELQQAFAIIALGIQHEEQHQELLLTDIKYNFSTNPLRPIYHHPAPDSQPKTTVVPALDWHTIAEGIYTIGHEGDSFSFDNETPVHKVYLAEAALASRLVTNGEFLHFMQDGGYTTPKLWLAEGWDLVKAHGWQAPAYWEQHERSWVHFTLHGMQPIDLASPVCHVSYYEADAFARWAGRRLPTEQEWEVLAKPQSPYGHLLDFAYLYPRRLDPHPRAWPAQMFGDVWEWTSSAYAPYPAYQAPAGAVGEYNGKFMCNQYVLRGGSCVTPTRHIRASYRNFFPAAARWQFSGIRLSKDMKG